MVSASYYGDWLLGDIIILRWYYGTISYWIRRCYYGTEMSLYYSDVIMKFRCYCDTQMLLTYWYDTGVLRCVFFLMFGVALFRNKLTKATLSNRKLQTKTKI